MNRPPFKSKTCSKCGLILATRRAWEALRYLGLQEDGLGWLELRNCECGTTLAIVVDQGRMHMPSRRRLVVYVDPSGRMTARSAGDRSLVDSDIWAPLAKVNVPRGKVAIPYIRDAYEALVRVHGWL